MLTTVKPDITDLYNLMQSQIRSLDEQKANIADLVTRVGGIERSSASAVAISNDAVVRARDAQSQVEHLKKQQLSKSMEISGVPLLDGEIVMDIVMRIANTLGITISEGDINTCYRLGHLTKLNAKGVPSPPVIVVDFLREITRNEVLAAARAFRRSLSNADLGWQDTQGIRIYLNERLTPLTRRIFTEARKARAQNKFKFVWTRNGRVHARVSESSPMLILDSMDDIRKAMEAVDQRAGISDVPSAKDGVMGTNRESTVISGAGGSQSASQTSSKVELGTSMVLRKSKRDRNDLDLEAGNNVTVNPPKIPRRGRPRKEEKEAPPIPIPQIPTLSDFSPPPNPIGENEKMELVNGKSPSESLGATKDQQQNGGMEETHDGMSSPTKSADVQFTTPPSM